MCRHVGNGRAPLRRRPRHQRPGTPCARSARQPSHVHTRTPNQRSDHGRRRRSHARRLRSRASSSSRYPSSQERTRSERGHELPVLGTLGFAGVMVACGASGSTSAISAGAPWVGAVFAGAGFTGLGTELETWGSSGEAVTGSAKSSAFSRADTDVMAASHRIRRERIMCMGWGLGVGRIRYGSHRAFLPLLLALKQ